MRNKKKLIVLCGVLAVLVIAVLCVKGAGVHREKIKAESRIVVSFEEDDVTVFSWTRGNSSFAFTKTENGWTYDKDESFPVNQDEVDYMLALVKDYSCSFVIEEPESLSAYELVSPKLKISVKTADNEYDISFGGYSSMDEERYFSTGDGNVYLAEKDIYDEFDCLETDFAQLDEILEIKTVSSFEISGENELKLIYREDAGLCYSDEYTYYLDEDGKYTPLSDSIAEELVQELTKADLDEYVTYKVSDADLNKYNLTDPQITATAYYSDDDGNEQSFTMYISKDDDKAYATLIDSTYIYELDEDVYDAFAEASYDTLKPRELVNVDWDKVTHISAELDGTGYDISCSGSGKKLKYSYNGEELEDDLRDDLQDAIEDLNMTGITTDSAVKKSEIEFTLSLDSDSYPSYTVSLYQYDSKSCLAKINGNIYGLVSRSSVVDLVEAVNSIILD